MGYSHGIYISAVLSLGTDALGSGKHDDRAIVDPCGAVRKPAGCGCAPSTKLRFACVCRRFSESVLRLVVRSKGALPPVRWYTVPGVPLSSDPVELMNGIVAGRVLSVVVENLGYRNGNSGKIIDLSEFWVAWDASPLPEGMKLRSATKVIRKTVESERRRVEREERRQKFRWSLRPPSGG